MRLSIGEQCGLLSEEESRACEEFAGGTATVRLGPWRTAARDPERWRTNQKEQGHEDTDRSSRSG